MPSGQVFRPSDVPPLLSLGSNQPWALTSLPLSSATLGLPCSEPQFPHLESVNNRHPYLTRSQRGVQAGARGLSPDGLGSNPARAVTSCVTLGHGVTSVPPFSSLGRNDMVGASRARFHPRWG